MGCIHADHVLQSLLSFSTIAIVFSVSISVLLLLYAIILISLLSIIKKFTLGFFGGLL